MSKQFDFQEVVGPNSVVLVYDPLRTTHGSMPLRAFRLTDAFMKAYRAKKFPLQEYDDDADDDVHDDGESLTPPPARLCCFLQES